MEITVMYVTYIHIFYDMMTGPAFGHDQYIVPSMTKLLHHELEKSQCYENGQIHVISTGPF